MTTDTASGDRPRLAQRTVGDGGPWVVVLHGLFGRGRNWQAVARALAEHYRVCLVDLPNHGNSPWVGATAYPEMAGDLVRLLDELGAVRPWLVGHSMGGKVAMWTALQAPERVAGLVVVDIAPVTYGHDHHDLVAALQGLDLTALRRRADADDRLAAAIPDRTLRQFLLQNLLVDEDGVRWQIDLAGIRASMAALTSFPATTARYQGPTLAIVGGASSYVDARGEAALRRHFPTVAVARLAGVGHWPHAERPRAVIELLARFLDDAGGAVPE